MKTDRELFMEKAMEDDFNFDNEVTKIINESHAKRLMNSYRKACETLRLIATPMRPDGTWNRDREACRQLAQDALDGK